MKKTFIVHPFLFAVYPILFLFCHDIEIALVVPVLKTMIIMISFTFLLWTFLSFGLKGKIKAGLVVTIFLCWVFFYGYFFDIGAGLGLGSFLFWRNRYFIVFWTVGFILSIYFIIRRRRPFNNLTNILNIVSISLIIFCLFDVRNFEIKK